MKLSEQYKRKLNSIDEKILIRPAVGDTTKTGGDDIFGIGPLNDLNFAGLSLLTWAKLSGAAIVGWRGKVWWDNIRGNKGPAQAIGFWTRNGLNPTALISKYYKDPKALKKFQTQMGLSDKDIYALLNDCKIQLIENAQKEIDDWLALVEAGQATPKQALSKIFPLLPRGKARRDVMVRMDSRYAMGIAKKGTATSATNTSTTIPAGSTGKPFGWDWDHGIKYTNITGDDFDKLSKDIRNKLADKIKNGVIKPEDVTYAKAYQLAY